MMSKDSILDYIKNKESNFNDATRISLYIMETLLEYYSVIRFKFAIAEVLKKGISDPTLFNVYKDIIEFIGD